MFERYDEHARRSIFFARQEASHLGSAWIETEHLLLGILQEMVADLLRTYGIGTARYRSVMGKYQ